jgi:hypothetical protein
MKREDKGPKCMVGPDSWMTCKECGYDCEDDCQVKSNLGDFPWWRKDNQGWPIELYDNSPIGNAVRILFQNIRKITG